MNNHLLRQLSGVLPKEDCFRREGFGRADW